MHSRGLRKLAKDSPPHTRGIIKTKYILDGFEVKLTRVKLHKGLKHGYGTEYYDKEYDGYSLSCNWVHDYKSGDGVLWNADSTVILEGPFVDDFLEGWVKIYDPETGNITMEGEAKAGKWEGNVKIYSSKGQIIFEGEYSSGYPHGNGVENGKPGLWVNGIRIPGYYSLEKSPLGTGKRALIETNSSGIVIYRGNYNPISIMKEGLGLEYDRVTGDLLYEYEYLNGEKIRRSKRFMNKHMDEYDLRNQVVYQGFFVGDYWNGIYRDCLGVEYGSDGRVVYSGYWTKGVHAENSLKIEPLQQELLRIKQEKSLLDSQRADPTLVSSAQANWNQRLQTLKQSMSELWSIVNDIEVEASKLDPFTPFSESHGLYPHFNAVTSSFYCDVEGEGQEISEFVMKRISGLNQLNVAEYCFEKVKTCAIEDCNDLKCVQVSPGAFTTCTYFKRDTPWNDAVKSRILSEKRSLSLARLPSLETISIGHRAFVDFTSFDVSGCHQLQSITIGSKMSGYCDCFYWCSSFTLKNLPSLQSLSICGEAVLTNCDTVTLCDLPLFNSFQIHSIGVLQAKSADEGTINLSGIPSVIEVHLGPAHLDGNADVSFLRYRTIKRGKNVSMVLLGALLNHIRSNGVFNDVVEQELVV